MTRPRRPPRARARDGGAALATLLLVSACGGRAAGADPADPFADAVRCEEPRPEVCTFQHDPVCALSRPDGCREGASCEGAVVRRTASNACMACANPDVEAWQPGACPVGDGASLGPHGGGAGA